MKSPLIVLFVIVLGCNAMNEKQELSIINNDGKVDGTIIKTLVKSNNITHVIIIRSIGTGHDTTAYELIGKSCFFGPRIITMGNEWFHSRDFESTVTINGKNLTIRNNSKAFNYGDNFTQEYVDNYWERDNHPLLNKSFPKIKGKQFRGEETVLDRESFEGQKILLHFGFLACQGCQQELEELNKLKVKRQDLQIVHITPDSSTKLQKFLIVEEDRFVIRPPYNRFGKAISKRLILDDGTIAEKFSVRGYPMNFLIKEDGTIDSVGGLINIFANDLKK